MTEQIPFLLFQHQYGRKWITYNLDELKTLNKAVKRSAKTITLPFKDDKKKIIVNLDKMMQKNAVSGYEQNIRCIIHNSNNIIWLWKDDYENLISFTPRAAIMLEIAYVRKEKNIEIFLRENYKFNLEDFFQMNLQTNYVRPISRDIVDVNYPQDAMVELLLIKAQSFIMKMSREDINRSKAVIFKLEYSPLQSHSSSPISAPTEIISALNAEAEASSVQSEIAVVDPEVPDSEEYDVFIENDSVYNATLNLTNVINNSNKYFIIQLLKKKNSNQYSVWFHWGRLGYKGQTNLVECSENLNEAKSQFQEKFSNKTGNNWCNRKNFVRDEKKYDLVHGNLALEAPNLLTSVGSRLDIKVQDLLRIISNKKSLEDAAKELCFDSKNTPLGKIQAKQILEGYSALSQIANLIKEKNKISPELINACNIFYTKIPHDFKRKAPPIITTISQVKEKLSMLEDLTQISLAYNVIHSITDRSVNIIDKYYQHLQCDLTPLDHSSDEFQALNMYLTETHGATHSAYNMELIEAFICIKTPEVENFRDVGNKILLWHGSRLSNWLGILKTGLQIAPPEAPTTGYMFGKGLYFADCSSKSANYCFASKKNNEGLLLLSEVSLGRSMTMYEAEDCSRFINEGFNSIFAPGRTKPIDFQSTILSTEATVPVGPLVDSNDDLTLQYNEYVVYDTKQVKMRYLLRIKFNFK